MKTINQALIEMLDAAQKNNRERVLELNAYIEVKNEKENKTNNDKYLKIDNARMSCFMAVKKDEQDMRLKYLEDAKERISKIEISKQNQREKTINLLDHAIRQTTKGEYDELHKIKNQILEMSGGFLSLKQTFPKTAEKCINECITASKNKTMEKTRPKHCLKQANKFLKELRELNKNLTKKEQ